MEGRSFVTFTGTQSGLAKTFDDLKLPFSGNLRLLPTVIGLKNLVLPFASLSSVG
jgi:hypothetical protein